MQGDRAHLQTAEEYLSHAYDIPRVWPSLPMPDEPFVTSWREGSGREVLDFLADEKVLPVHRRTWENREAISISFAQTMGGKLPVITTGSHCDFRQMEALLNAREEVRKLPITVNAFAMVTRAESIFRHRILLLNRAPYSNLQAGEEAMTFFWEVQSAHQSPSWHHKSGWCSKPAVLFDQKGTCHRRTRCRDNLPGDAEE